MGRNGEMNESIRKKRMEEIEGGALYYFAKYGLAGARISDLAKYLGISQGLLYRYYPSKEALFKTCSQKWISTRDQIFKELVEVKMSAEDKILALTKHVETSMKKNKIFACYFTIFENDSLTSGTKEGSLFFKWSAQPIEMLSKIIEQGQREGTIHKGNSIQLSIGYWELVFAYSHNYIASDSLENFDFNLLNRILLINR